MLPGRYYIKRAIFVLAIVLITLELPGALETTGNSGTPHKVLIAKEDTGYKKRLMNELINELDGIDPADYNAVFGFAGNCSI